MKRFSIGRSIGEGFGLIGRRPLAVFVWGFLMLAPTFGALGLMMPAMGEIFASMPEADVGAGGDTVFPDAMVAQMMQFQLGSMLANLGQYLMMALVYTAVFRAVLRPRESSFFSLRIGMEELRVAVAGIAIGLGIYVVMVIGIIVCVALGFALWSQGPSTAIWTVGIVGGLLLLAILWGLARLSLIAPGSVLYRDFAFAQGWRLAAGKSWPLLGMMVLIYLMFLAFYIVVVIVLVSVISTTAMVWNVEHDANPFAGMEAWMATHWPWLVAGGLFASMVYGVFMTLMIAPFASACRQLDETSNPRPLEDSASPEPAL